LTKIMPALQEMLGRQVVFAHRHVHADLNSLALKRQFYERWSRSTAGGANCRCPCSTHISLKTNGSSSRP
jgi:hypothetical protein